MCVQFNSVTTSKRGCEGAPHEHRYQSNFTHVSARDENVCLAAKSCGERMQTSSDSGVDSSSEYSRETDITIYYMSHRWNLLDTSQKNMTTNYLLGSLCKALCTAPSLPVSFVVKEPARGNLSNVELCQRFAMNIWLCTGSNADKGIKNAVEWKKWGLG
ncbi:hypothetical protein HBI79_044720 [Parastagonospora nodorum]|nr:hypothetical protein HBI79_044720 [Parastagonospora nodorum]